MAKQPEPLAVAPNMPATSIDFDKFHAAVTAGKAPEKVIEASDLTPPPPPEEKSEAGLDPIVEEPAEDAA
jgi:hypothetical protein